MLPTHQCLDPHQIALETNLGLIVDYPLGHHLLQAFRLERTKIQHIIVHTCLYNRLQRRGLLQVLFQ
ncbi:hypothetical protein D3C76_1719280 [compost metagenome]